MAGEVWQQKRKKKKERRPFADLAVWCDANLSPSFARKLGTLVANSQALKSVVDILKAARTKGEVLNNAQRIALDGQLRGAGPWEVGAGPASAGGKVAARPARAREALSKDTKRSARTTSAAATAGVKDPALRESERLLAAALKETKRLKQELAERQPAADSAAGTADVSMVDEEAQTWACVACTADHSCKSYKKLTCRICEVHRSAVSSPAATPVGRSTEEVEAERASLLASKGQLAVMERFFGAAHVATALKKIETELRDLDSPPAEPAAKDPFVRMHEAKAAVDKAALYHARLHTRASSIEERIALMHADLVAVGAAIERADHANELAKAELAAAATATAALTTTSREPSPETGGDAVHLADAAQLADKAYMALLEEELAGGTFTGPELLQRISAKLATRARIPVPAVAAAPLAASQQARLHPPRGTPATAHGVHGGDAPRVGQRPSPKFISAESIAAASANILKSAERGRKEGRDHLLDAGRADADESGNATPV